MSVVERLERCLTSVSDWMATNHLKLNAEKTELPWAGSRHSAAVLGNNGPFLKLGQDTVAPSNHVRVLGVTVSSDLISWAYNRVLQESCWGSRKF